MSEIDNKSEAENEEKSPENFVNLLDRLILEGHLDGIPLLLQDNRNLDFIKDDCYDAFQMCLKYLTEENYEKRNDTYMCCENLLKVITEHASQNEGLLFLLEMIEKAGSDNVFTSALKALQINLLRQPESKARSLEWALNSVQFYLSNLKFPEKMQAGYDSKQEKLLEDDADIQKILTNYITVFMFYEPVLDDIKQKSPPGTFRDTNITRKNVMLCFILQLLDKPLAYLDLSNQNRKTNSYSIQCARTLIQDTSKLIGDPFFFLDYIETRIRWKKSHPKDGVYEMASKDIFLIEEKISLISYGVYYYLLLVENLLPSNAPKIYSKQYILEMCLYLAHELLKCEEGSLQYKGIKLGQKLMESVGKHEFDSSTFELKIHSDFSKELSKVIVYSNYERNRKQGFLLFKSYVDIFDDEGTYVLLKNLIQNTTHVGLLGYLIIAYKDLVAKNLNLFEKELPEYVSGEKFRFIILNIVCKLKQDIATDLMQNSDHVISALNVLRFFAIRDSKNQTGFWNFTNDIQTKFLNPLRTAIDMSRAHFKEEAAKVQAGKDLAESMKSSVDISLMSGEDFPDITKEQKLKLLGNAFVTFDLVESLLGRVVECIENRTFNKSNKS